MADNPESAAPIVYAHRGASADAPENTLASFKLAAERGAEAIELDIHQCASGELVVIHDDNLGRTGGTDVSIRDSLLETIRTHEVGSWFDSRFAGEKVPLLEEVFALLGTSIRYDVEIKSSGAFWGAAKPDGIEVRLAKLIRDSGLSDHCIVSSFDPLAIRRFSKVAPEIPTGLIYTNSKKAPATIRRGRGLLLCSPAIMKPHSPIVTKQYVERQHRKGRTVIAWTVDDPEEARRLVKAGVDGIASNKPAEIRAAIV